MLIWLFLHRLYLLHARENFRRHGRRGCWFLPSFLFFIFSFFVTAFFASTILAGFFASAFLASAFFLAVLDAVLDVVAFLASTFLTTVFTDLV